MEKTILICLVVTFLGITFVLAQDKKKIGGIRAGFHSASMVEEGSKPDTAKSLNSFYIGFFRDTKLIPLLHFGTGMEYFQNGLAYTDNSKRVLHTLAIPLNLKVKAGPLFGRVGASPNVKVSEKIHLGDNKVSPLDSDKSNWFDIAAFAGAGVKILFLSVEVRYHWGLLEARDDMYNRYLQIGAAVSF